MLDTWNFSGEAVAVKLDSADLALTFGERFFHALVDSLAAEFRADYASVCALHPDMPGRAVTLAGIPNDIAIEFDLAGTPEGRLIDAGPAAQFLDIGSEFTGDARMARLQAKEWNGILLTGSSGRIVGVLSLIFRERAGDAGEIARALARLAPRTAAEIEALQTRDSLRRAESRYQDLITHGREGVWCLQWDPPIPVDLPVEQFVARIWDARIAVANDAAARLIGQNSASDVVGRAVTEFKPMLPHTDSQSRELIELGFRPRTLEFAVVRDGVESWWERSVLPMVESGKLVRMWGTSRDISERKRQEAAIQDLNRNLEYVVADRTTQLDAANQELESFSYSVSHDLRAAIQGIVASSRIVMQDHAAQLDDKGRTWLNYIADDAAQLDKLTLALLDLSMVSRAGLCRGQVDLSVLAESVARGLEESNPARKSDFRIAPGLKVSADPALLRSVMENLLGNSWKFTRAREVAEIEVGVTGQGGEPAYFVRDNGVGFNMKYAGKLFGAFQRLHRVGDYDGSGIGLATVRRVIHRHGGRVWAEAEMGRGATFFFTLGKLDSR